MATKKTVDQAEEVKEEVAQAEEVAKEEAPAEVDEWDIIDEMIVPRKPKGDDPSYYVCVNDRRFLIPADGKMQKLPRPVANVLRDSLEAEMEAEDFADSMPKMFT